VNENLKNKTLMVSISGIRGIFGEGLDPDVLVNFAGAFGTWCKKRALEKGKEPLVVVGRDARVSGPVCAGIVMSTLRSTGCDVYDAGLATTPTVEIAVIDRKGIGGIVLSASHNPEEWNALKLLNEKGEFLSAKEGQEVIRINGERRQEYVRYDRIGSIFTADFLPLHIEHILNLSFIDTSSIAARRFRIVLDGINSVGGIAVPALLRKLGVSEKDIICLNGEPTGRFAHTAEPLAENLVDLTEKVVEYRADLGIAVDPDVDRLALVMEDGRYLSEELTQVLAADFLWRFRSGPFVTNLSSSRAIEDVARRYGNVVYRSAVGEINVVKKMQAVDAVLGGEGNGGVILPDLHYGRDALIGIAMILQHLANEKTPFSVLCDRLPRYAITKNKMQIQEVDPDAVLGLIAQRYSNERIDLSDGVKIDFDKSWVHLRKSNTEPILRIYTEAETEEAAQDLGRRFMDEIAGLI